MGISGDFNVRTNKGNFSNFVESETHSTSQKLIECGHMTKWPNRATKNVVNLPESTHQEQNKQLPVPEMKT